MSLIAITFETESQKAKAVQLAAELGLPLITPEVQDYDFWLVVTPVHLELRDQRSPTSKSIFIDFLAGKSGYRFQHVSKKNELLAKAVGLKAGYLPYVLDLTAGLGQDAFILAALGCEVEMVERSPIVAALLMDALTRVRQDKRGSELEISLHFSQAIDFIDNLFCMNSRQPDVVYLDPMYPERSKSALGKKEMRILHAIVGADEDASELLQAALKVAKKRVVVKRPKLADSLAGLKPDIIYSHGKSSRFDVYLVANHKVDVVELKGCLPKPKIKASLKAMRDAIRQCGAQQ